MQTIQVYQLVGWLSGFEYIQKSFSATDKGRAFLATEITKYFN